ncbi:MAG TPA: radical SAM protein [Bacillota bacterium]|nr:radical SAM protein [Bacillota bacterium]
MNQKAAQLDRVNFSITKHCNLHCRMCDYKKMHSRTKDFPLDRVKAIIQEATGLGMKVLELTGGEPMARRDVYEIISYAHSLGLMIAMATNGTLINQAVAKKLVEAGLTSVSLSLEGSEQLNDHIRGRGNYQKALNAVRGFLSCRPEFPELEVKVGITLSKYNYQSIISLSKYLIEEVGVTGVSINPFNSVMLAPDKRLAGEKEFNISAELMPDFSRELERLIEYCKSMPDKMPSPIYLSRIPDYFMGKKLIPSGGCKVPQSFCGISVTGWVFSCWHSAPIGNLFQQSLTDILNSEAQRKFCDLALQSKCPGCLSSCYPELY